MKTFDKDVMEMVEDVKRYKTGWMKVLPGSPDQNPTVFAKRDGKVVACFVAPSMEKKLGLFAASMVRRGMAADEIMLICDAHMKSSKEGESVEEFEKRYQDEGSMQDACDNHGACKTREITDCMNAVTIRADLTMSVLHVPYFYDDKKAGEFHWFDDEINYGDDRDPENQFSGFIPDALRAIMAEKTILEDDVAVEISRALKFDRDRTLAAGEKSTTRVLKMFGFLDMGTPMAEPAGKAGAE